MSNILLNVTSVILRKGNLKWTPDCTVFIKFAETSINFSSSTLKEVGCDQFILIITIIIKMYIYWEGKLHLRPKQKNAHK